MNRYFYKVCVVRELDCGERQSVQFTMTVISDDAERAEQVARTQIVEQYFDWEHWVWPIDFYSWAAIRERENAWALKLVRMKAEGVFA
jgi:hypothetical protein